MREILFRGKNEYGVWVYGMYIPYQNGEAAILYEKFSAHGYEATELCQRSKVIPETVGQFTGITDRNGNKIFEGDILSFADVLGFVNYNYGCYCVKTNKPDWHSRTNPAIDIIMCEYEEKVQVIGNVHDNPELISGDGNAN